MENKNEQTNNPKTDDLQWKMKILFDSASNHFPMESRALRIFTRDLFCCCYCDCRLCLLFAIFWSSYLGIPTNTSKVNVKCETKRVEMKENRGKNDTYEWRLRRGVQPYLCVARKAQRKCHLFPCKHLQFRRKISMQITNKYRYGIFAFVYGFCCASSHPFDLAATGEETFNTKWFDMANLASSIKQQWLQQTIERGQKNGMTVSMFLFSVSCFVAKIPFWNTKERCSNEIFIPWKLHGPRFKQQIASSWFVRECTCADKKRAA